MAIKNKKRGFALFIAVIFMSVMLSFGLALGSLGYKQAVLASSAIESQYAFYAADAGLECALYADQQLNLFAFPSDITVTAPPVPMSCDNHSPYYPQTVLSRSANEWAIESWLSLDSGSRCADVRVYKPALGSGIPTYLFSQGYDVPCDTVKSSSNARFVSRGVQAHY